MCVKTIIDANMLGELRSDSIGAIRKWIERQDGTLVYPDSGQYHEELAKSPQALGWFERRRQQGSATLIRRDEMTVADRRLGNPRLRSNDRHVIVLALASDALVLCTNDGSLKEDFKNSDLLPRVGREARAVYPLPRPPDQRSGFGPGRQIEQTQRDFLDRRQCALRRRR